MMNEAVKIAKYMSEFLFDYAPNYLTYSTHTIKSYKDTLTLYISFLESVGITPNNLSKKQFEKESIMEWITWMQHIRGCCPDTCNVRLGALRVFLEYLGSKDIEFLYLYQEAKTIRRLKCPKKKVEGLAREVVSAIFQEPNLNTKTGRRDIAFLTLLYGTAARIGEILGAKVEHLHLELEKPYLTLYGKGGKMRTAYLLPRVADNVREYLREFHGTEPCPNDYIFYSRVGENRGKLTEPAIDKRIKIYAASAHEKCNKVPQNIHAHQFRHAKASHWLEDGINIVQISFLLGHQNLDTTMKYLDITTEAKISALATLETEDERKITKKWKTNMGTLSEFFGLK